MSLTPKWIRRASRGYRRFQQDLDTARADIEARKKQPDGPPEWISDAEALLKTAEERKDAGDLDGA